MVQLAANLTFLFKEVPFLERFAAAADAGFDAVEVLFPYDDPVPAMVEALTRAGLPLALINGPPPNYTGGARGFAAVPGARDRFRSDFRRVLRYARALKPRHIHIMAGAAEGTEARRVFEENLAWAAAEAPTQSLTIEPINHGDMPGYYLADFNLATEVIAAVGAPNLGLQFDSYHAQIITGDAVACWQAHAPLVRHVQLSSPPDRGEPGAGAVDWAALYRAIRDSDYDGVLSGEYHPAGDTAAGLGWLADARAALGA
jgi:hydroxypyruvate isomerase